MNIWRAGHCAVLLQKHIYAIGGHNNESYQKSVERYNPVTNQWQTIRDISNASTFAAVAVSNGKVRQSFRTAPYFIMHTVFC